MPQFRIKNLSIDVVSGAQAANLRNKCVVPTIDCTKRVTVCAASQFCHLEPMPTCLVWSPVRGCVDLTDHNCVDTEPIACQDSAMIMIELRALAGDPEMLKDVQYELGETLKALAERGMEAAQGPAPQTWEQADQLEKELQAALEEVRNLKNTLK